MLMILKSLRIISLLRVATSLPSLFKFMQCISWIVTVEAIFAFGYRLFEWVFRGFFGVLFCPQRFLAAIVKISSRFFSVFSLSFWMFVSTSFLMVLMRRETYLLTETLTNRYIPLPSSTVLIFCDFCSN